MEYLIIFNDLASNKYYQENTGRFVIKRPKFQSRATDTKDTEELEKAIIVW